MVRNEIEAVLEGRGIALQLNGLYLTRGRQHVDNTIQVEHAAPGSTSDQFYKGVLDDQSRAVFAGRILVRRAAQKTNAYQSNANLLLSPDAEIDTKPELEIFADDVKCSHGATAGELDERALFYLRSRGLDPATARSLLTFAFADEVLERFGQPAVARQARRELLRWLPGGPSARGSVMTMAASRAAPTRAQAYDVERVRAQFPCLHQAIHGRPLVYLDSATSAQKPQARDRRADPHAAATTTPTSIAACTSSASARPTSTRAGASGCAASSARPTAREIVFTRNGTEAINLVAQSFVRPRAAAGDEVLITTMEHHANIVPWQLLRDQIGLKLVVAPITDRGRARARRADRADLRAHPAGLGALGLERARHDQPGARDRRRGACPRRAGAARRLPGGPAYPDRRAGSRLRLPGVLGPQAVRPVRHRRALRQGRRCSRRCRPTRAAAT